MESDAAAVPRHSSQRVAKDVNRCIELLEKEDWIIVSVLQAQPAEDAPTLPCLALVFVGVRA